MLINTRKKAVLLLSIISLNSSVFGMFEDAKKKMSTLVLSQKKQVAITVLVPLAAAGCYILAQHKEDISSLLERIPVPSEKVVFGLATAAAVPATYVLAGKFSPEEQFQLSHRKYEEINKHLILKNKTKLISFIQGEKTVQFDTAKKPITFLEFITNNFGSQVNDGLDPSINAANQLCDLERSINTECQRLQQIDDAGTSGVVVEKGQKSGSSIAVSQQLAQLEEDTLFIQQFRGMIIRLPEYKEDKKISPAIEKNKLTKDQISFGTKIAAFIPLFLPFVTNSSMILLQSILNAFGLPYRVI